jgi:hypothetical protein
MTDTTDIAALRSKAANVIGLLTAEYLTGSFALDSLADVFDDMFRLLEAERQRAVKLDDRAKCAEAERDKNIAWHSKQLKRANDLEAKLAALKGEQVPVDTGIFTRDELISVCEDRMRDMPEDYAPYQIAKIALSSLFTAPQKPVVLLNSSAVMSRAYVVKQIEAAGGIVKDGE